MTPRFAPGRRNYLRLEIFGSEGSLVFNLERLNELEYYARSDRGDQQGFRTILVTEAVHPYMKSWWPPGHAIGWEHTFIHEISDMLAAVAAQKSVSPDFYQGYRCQQVLDAIVASAQSKKWVSVPAE